MSARPGEPGHAEAAGDRGDDRQWAEGAGRFDCSGEGWRALWVVCALCGVGYAGNERVDAQDTGVGADRARADRGPDEYELFLTELPDSSFSGHDGFRELRDATCPISRLIVQVTRRAGQAKNTSHSFGPFIPMQVLSAPRG